MWDNTQALSLKKRKKIPVFHQFFFFVVQTEKTQREKYVQQDIAVQSYLRFLDLTTVLGMHSFKVECWRYIFLLTIHDISVALIKKLEINLSGKSVRV